MKKAMYVLLAAVGVVLLSIVSSLSYLHYVNKDDPFTQEDTGVTIQLENAVENVLNPTFLSVDEVIQFKELTAQEDSIDATFMLIPKDVLVNISQVVIGNTGKATKKSIVEEFRRHYKPIYQYIKPLEQFQQSTNTTPNDTTKSIRGIRDDTIINGGKTFVLIKETSSNE